MRQMEGYQWRASMGPPHECDGMRPPIRRHGYSSTCFNGAAARMRRNATRVAGAQKFELGLQWGRRTNATECFAAAEADRGDGGFNGAAARMRRNAQVASL